MISFDIISFEFEHYVDSRHWPSNGTKTYTGLLARDYDELLSKIERKVGIEFSTYDRDKARLDLVKYGSIMIKYDEYDNSKVTIDIKDTLQINL